MDRHSRGGVYDRVAQKVGGKIWVCRRRRDLKRCSDLCLVARIQPSECWGKIGFRDGDVERSAKGRAESRGARGDDTR